MLEIRLKRTSNGCKRKVNKKSKQKSTITGKQTLKEMDKAVKHFREMKLMMLKKGNF